MTSGSGTLVRSLLNAGVVEELSLLVYPVVVGRGQRLFTEQSEPQELTLARSTAFDNGVLHLVYVPPA